jgi:alkyldihydroxyacetonephosphate synthase
MSRQQIGIPARAPSPAPGGPVARIAAIEETLDGRPVEVDDAFVRRLASACAEVATDEGSRIAAGRDWWPLGMVWATTGRVARLPAVVARPATTDEVAAVLRLCNEHRVPVTAAGGRSGVLGNSLPVFGGVVLDCTLLSGILDLNDTDLTVDVAAGTFGDDLEAALRGRGYTLGHWPQSIALSTVGGWIACRSAGQMSTRYGTVADMTKSVTVALADGRLVATSEFSRSATGPDSTQLFVGSEGTLGIITSARLRIHPAPSHTVKAAFAFRTFDDGVDAIRRFMRRGATPAVVRLYDDVESRRNFATSGEHVLILYDEGEAALVEAGWSVVLSECRTRAADTAFVDRWLAHRNDVKTVDALIRDRAPDTMEVTGPWSRIAEIYHATTRAIAAVPGTRTATAHISHAYTDSAGLYFMFGGRPDVDARPRWYRDVWDAAARTALAHGGNLSHHHGVGLGRGRFMREALGTSFPLLEDLKRTLDPNGILNPGKLGLHSPFGPPPDWADLAATKE